MQKKSKADDDSDGDAFAVDEAFEHAAKESLRSSRKSVIFQSLQMCTTKSMEIVISVIVN